MDTQYKYWCSTEKNWIFEWATTEPTVCKNSNTHTISDITQFMELQHGNREIIVNEQRFKKNGIADFFIEGIKMDIQPNTTTVKLWSQPLDINILEIRMFPYSVQTDEDVISVIINPDFLCGVTTESVTSGSNTIPVSETVLKYIRKPGWFIPTISDGVNSDEMGKVISIDRENSTITTEFPVTNNYNSGTLIKVNYYIMKDKHLYRNLVGISGGDSKIGSTLIPANTIVKIIYENKSNIPKIFLVDLEYTW